MPEVRSATTSSMEIVFEESGPADGPAVILMHGFPYSVRAYDDVVRILTAAGRRCVVPHLRGYIDGDAALEAIEQQLAAQPPIAVPTINLDGADGGFGPPDTTPEERAHFTGAYEHRILTGVGHNVPQEAPEAFAAAVLDLAGRR